MRKDVSKMGKLLILSVTDHEEHILNKIMELIAIFHSEVLSRSTTVPLLKKWRTISGITAASSR